MAIVIQSSNLPARASLWQVGLKAQRVGRFFLSIIFIMVLANNALADTLLVPNYYLTIQEAILASNPGDTIIVASGVHRLYSGNIRITNKDLTYGVSPVPKKQSFREEEIALWSAS